MQSLKERLSFLGCPYSVRNSPLPIPPIRHILQLLIERAVLQILGAHDTRSSARIDEIVEFDLTRAAIFAGPGGRDWAARVHVCDLLIHDFWLDFYWDEFKRVDFDAIEDLGALLPGVAEHEVVRFGADNVPGVAVWAGVDDEIGV